MPHAVYYVFLTLNSVILADIYLDGVRAALRKIKEKESRLLKWLVVVMVLHIFLSLCWILTWLMFQSLGTPCSMYYNYAVTIIINVIPALLVIALATCGKECDGENKP